MKKRIFSLFLALTLVTMTFVTPAMASEPSITLVVNHDEVTTDQSPVLIDNMLYIPFRALFDSLGGEVLWDETSRTATGIFDETIISVQIDSSMVKTTLLGDFYYEEIQLINGRLLVSAEFVANHLPVYIYWLEELNGVLIATPSEGFFWEVRHNGNTVYLLGSIHLGSPALYPMKSEIEYAFLASDYLVVELAGIDEGGFDYMQQIQMFDDGTTLKDSISEDLYNEVIAFYAEFGVPEEVINQYKPWALSLEISNLKLAMQGYSGDYGIETYFLTNKPENMPIIELEGLIYQLDSLNDYSPALQEFLLADALADNEEFVLIDVWKKGDLEFLEAIYSFETDDEIDATSKALLEEYMDKLMTKRNYEMTDNIEELFLKGTEEATYFVIVGAGHYVGEEGIINLLLNRGYEVISYNK